MVFNVDLSAKMIFEFLKKLFWKADEGNRKRKFNNSDICNSSVKKRPKSVTDINVYHECNGRFNSESSNVNWSDNIYSFDNLTQLDSDMICDKTDLDIFQSPTTWSSSKINNIHEHDRCQKEKYKLSSLKQFELPDQSTLFKTQRLAEKKQYSKMLLNFMPSKAKEEEEAIIDNKENVKVMVSNKENKSNYEPNSSDDHKYRSKKTWLSTNILTPNISYSMDRTNFKEVNKTNDYSETNSRLPVEIIKTNTLKDELSTKNVLKPDFILQITEKYNKRMEQHQKEAQELKKVACMLSKHNQLLREANLEDQLNHSMRLCEIILDERVDDKELELPELSGEMIESINRALSPGPGDEILVQSFGLRITRKDIQTLAGLNWLNDEIINFYMNLLITRSNKENYPNVYAMNTFFYPKLVSSGHLSLKRWTRKVDIFAKDLLVVPIHLGIHWCMSIIDFRNKSIKYYDSMGSQNNKCLQVLKQYLYDESIDKKKKPFEFKNWIFECVKDIPQQMNGSDCGVFSCMFAEYICANKPLNFNQDDMPYFRNKMVYEILNVQLL